VYFYVADPDVIPADFNLLTIFDPRALSVTDWAVEGFGVFDGPTPRKTHLTGKGAVPFWFIAEAQLATARSDGFINMPEFGTSGSYQGICFQV
jgi:hypothetical protein